MPTLYVRLFGRLSIQRGEYVLAGLDAGKVQELFCYLLLHRDRSHRRETLASLLWGDTSTAQSKAYFRKALWRIHATIDPPTEYVNACTLLVEPDWIQINPAADLWLDIAVLEQAYDRVQGTPGEQIDDDCAQALRRAVEVYRGDLLDGWYQDWCLYERERLQSIYLSMLDKLMVYCECHREYECGINYGLHILRLDRAREQTYHRLMRLYYLAGDRIGALRQYEHCVAALKEELGVQPAAAVTTLFEHIRANHLDDRGLIADYPDVAPEAVTRLTDVLSLLKQMQTNLFDLQRQVQQAIKGVEQALNGRH